MNMRAPGHTPKVDRGIGDAFPIVEEVYRHLEQLKYLAENSEKFVSAQIEFKADPDLESILWKYEKDDEWKVLVTYAELTGVDLSSLEEELNQIIDNSTSRIKDSLKEELNTFDGVISSSPSWSDVPAHSDPAFDAQAQALANQAAWLKLRSHDAINFSALINPGMTISEVTQTIQAVIDSGASLIYGSDGVFDIDAPLVVSNSKTHIKLSHGCHIRLNTNDEERTPVVITGANSSITGGKVSSTLRETKWYIELIGDDSFARGVDVSHPTKSTSTVMLYNRGGIACKGKRSAAVYCDVYNVNGIGIVTYDDSCRVYKNNIHDNIAGVHLSDKSVDNHGTQILDNMIYNNNVNHESGACGILGGSKSYGVLVERNFLAGNGEHGTYLYCKKSKVTNNVATGNWRNGIKVRNVVDTDVVENIAYDNNVMGEPTSGEIVLQVQDGNVANASLKGNIARHSSGNGYLQISYVSQSSTCTGVKVEGNKADFMSLPFSSGIVVRSNEVDYDLIVGAALSTAPMTQLGAIVESNSCDRLTIGRCINSKIANNTCRTLGPASDATATNSFFENTITGQEIQINRGWFKNFSRNNVNCLALGLSNLFAQAPNSAYHSNQTIDENDFTGVGARLISDASAAVSGNNLHFCNNRSDGAFEMLSVWGEGHIIIGNRNSSGVTVGYVGCNNSYMVGNLPKINERSGTTGNVNV